MSAQVRKSDYLTMANPRKTPESDGDRDLDQDQDQDQDQDFDEDQDSSSQAGGDQPPRKRQRVRLSCLECRRRKLSCDRGFPCERCIKSGTPDRCSYESRTGEVVSASSGVPPHFAQLDPRMFGIGVGGGDGGGLAAAAAAGGPGSHDPDLVRQDHDRIRRLELEIAQLKAQLPRAPGSGSYDGSTVAGTISPATTTQKDDANTNTSTSTGTYGVGRAAAAAPPADVQECAAACNGSIEKGELSFFRGKGFRTRYFGPHNASMAFVELNGLCPFMRETADEWLRPVMISNRKDRKRRKEERELKDNEPDLELESLLPSRAEADVLIDVYLDQFEQVHRIIHVPTFLKEYEDFWEPGSKHRYAAFTAMLLSMMAVSSCVHTPLQPKFIGLVSNARHWAEKWIIACDDWISRQSQKHRRLIHFQIQCLLYLGKRVNIIKKKRFWTNAGGLIQDGIAVGLHREPSFMGSKISVYHQEMRRRIWATLQEFDMQASFDYGLPTLVSQLHFDTAAPGNLDDDDFDEDTTTMPVSKPTEEYTFSSFQRVARDSLGLRLELSRFLTGPQSDIDYDQVIRYTNDLTQEIDSLPSWDKKGENVRGKKNPLIAYTLLHIQLRQYIIPLHQPYLKLRKQNSKYQYSEIIYYNAARDIVLLHDKLHEQGVDALNFMREDALTTCINLCSITLLQPRGSTNMIMINSQHTAKLIERCIAMKEDKLLRCGNHEPWGYSIMCAALGLLEAHLGTKPLEVAKSTSAERFVQLQYRLVENQEPRIASANNNNNDTASTLVGGGGHFVMGPVANPGLDVPTRPKVEEEALYAPYMDLAADTNLQSTTPFTFTPSMQAMAGTGTTAMGVPNWAPDNADPMQLFNLDPSLELLGLNLNELWGENWELG